MLTRWFFRLGRSERDSNLFSKTPISGAFGERAGSPEAFLIQIPRSAVVIGFNPNFWKYQRQTHYRSAVQLVAERIALTKFHQKNRKPILMIWSNEEWVLDDRTDARVLTHARMRLESEVIWNWIGFVTSLPIAQQRSKQLHKEFDRWWSEQGSSLRMPELPTRR